MSDIVDDLLHLSEHPNSDPKCHRRQTIRRLVLALVTMADHGLGLDESQHRASIMQLASIVGDMAGKIAQADDVTFSAIVREAAMLVRSLQRRQAEMTRFTAH
jgi:hypothetical protein